MIKSSSRRFDQGVWEAVVEQAAQLRGEVSGEGLENDVQGEAQQPSPGEAWFTPEK